jgi:tetratricopeptide (TPR) repeat protein
VIALLLALTFWTALPSADAALELQYYEQAARLYRTHLQSEPDSYRALYGLARALAFGGQWGEALTVYDTLLVRYPDDPDARLGQGLVHAWRGEFEQAEAELAAITHSHPEYEDAWRALGNTYYWSGRVDALASLGQELQRAGRQDLAQRLLAQARQLAPVNPAVKQHDATLAAERQNAGARRRLVAPDTLTYPARAHGDQFEIRTADGWRPFYLKGVNLGAALPGRFPSQFPAAEVYVEWIEQMAAMGANTIRVYTIHPPAFYRALLDHNNAHREHPLWLIQGVWTGPPPAGDYADPVWQSAFFAEMHRVVDLIHGSAELVARPGHASGSYVADVSAWTLATIIGREWEPTDVADFLQRQPNLSGWYGDFLQVQGGNAMDAWLGRACEEIVAYETVTYRSQRPVAYTNWPTLDPLYHPTETTVAEELAIRAARGETVAVAPREFNNDEVGLDAALVTPTAAFPAGYFGAYHAYPYYPDFMVLDERYGKARSAFGPSYYFGYLQDLKAHHPDMPVVIAEYGVPASLGIAHLQPQGAHHGGHSERDMAAHDQRLTLEIAEAGMAGGIAFAWIDEWFKRNWLTTAFELPSERNRLWYNRLDAEQHYGMLAMEAEPAVGGATLTARLAPWREVPPLYATEGGGALRAAADGAYLWLLIETGPGEDWQQFMVGFDVMEPGAGDFHWPGRVGERLPVGAEFVLQVRKDGVRLLADPPQNQFRLVPQGTGEETSPPRLRAVQAPPPGMFQGRWQQQFNLPYVTQPNDGGQYEPLRVITNRRRFGRDGTEYAAAGYEWGRLREGPPPDGCWERLPAEGVLEVRIPWLLLNVTDPSSRCVLQNGFTCRPVSDIGIVAAWQTVAGAWRSWPAAGRTEPEPEAVARFTWPTWNEPSWSVRRRPVYDAMRETFAALGDAGERVSDVILTTATRSTVADDAGEPAADPPEVLGPGCQPITAEAADVAWREGDLERADCLYSALLSDDPQDARALHRLALLRAWDDRHAEALVLFDRLLALHPDNLEARLDRARVLGWSGQLERAIAEVDSILARQPGQLPALRMRGQFQAWAGQYDASLSTYDQLLAIDPETEQVRLSRAQVLTWAARFDAAVAAYDSLLAENPQHTEARLGRARVLAYAGRLDAAEAAYRGILAGDPDNGEALAGLARTLSWDGQLVASEAAWRQALSLTPADPTYAAGLAQNLRWQGRPGDALEVLQQATAGSSPGAEWQQEQLWIKAALGPRFVPSVVYESDSDENRMRTLSLSSSWYAQPRLGLRLDLYRRDAEQYALNRTSQGVTLAASRQFVPGWTLSGGLGGSFADGDGNDALAALRLSLASPGRYRWGGSLSYKHQALDATAVLIENGVQVGEWSLDGRGVLGSAWHARGGFSLADFTGRESNRRWAMNGGLKHRFTRSWSLGCGLRVFGFQKDLNDGYFDPDFYGIAEVPWEWRREQGSWSLRLEAVPGVQKVTRAGTLTGAVRASARLSYIFGPGREISLSGAYSSTGLHSFSTGDADYRYTAVVLAAGWAY